MLFVVQVLGGDRESCCHLVGTGRGGEGQSVVWLSLACLAGGAR